MDLTYYVIKCPHCGWWQIKGTKDVNKAKFICHSCQKIRKLKHKNKPELQVKYHGPYQTVCEANHKLKALKKTLPK